MRESEYYKKIKKILKEKKYICFNIETTAYKSFSDFIVFKEDKYYLLEVKRLRKNTIISYKKEQTESQKTFIKQKIPFFQVFVDNDDDDNIYVSNKFIEKRKISIADREKFILFSDFFE